MKPVVSTRLEPELKKEIVQEAVSKDRKTAWLLEKIIQKGWEAYKQEKAAA